MLRLSKKDKITFLDSFGSLLNSGIPVIRALQIIYFQSRSKQIREVTRHFKQRIEAGGSIANTAKEMPKIFTVFDVAMFETGDATGKVGHILRTLMEKEESELELQRKVQQALIYPVAIIFVAVAMVVTIMTYVIPKIEKIYRDSHVSLPELTQWIIAVSHFIRDFFPFILGGFAIFIFAGIWLGRIPSVRYAIDRSVLKIPFFGGLIQKKLLIIFSNFLSTLLGSGILINKALDIVGNGIGNAFYSSIVHEIMDDIRSGKTFSSSMGGEYIERKIKGENVKELDKLYGKRIECFPPEMSMAVKVGEQTGWVVAALERTAVRYGKEVDASVKNMSSVIEPVIIVGIGSIVGVIILGIMLPFFDMVNVIQ